ncbi:MAG TPA: hypothetical protein IAB56_04985 [Candidatus Scybalousia intestinigallinarum]|nr:hypothetical protein [Candidatus Scybalousia intestinigallinarum]
MKKRVVRKKKNRSDLQKSGKINAKQVYYFVMIFVYLYLIIACMYKYSVHQSLQDCLLELIFLLVLSVVIYFVHVVDFRSSNKKRFFRQKLMKKRKKKERIKVYFGEAILSSLLITTTFTLLVAFNNIFINFYRIIPNNVPLSVLLVVIACFIVFGVIVFIGDYCLSERYVKKYES